MARSMQVVIVGSFAAVALLGLQGCGGGGGDDPAPAPAPPPSCPSSDLFVFPSVEKPTGEVVYLQFDKKSCADNLNTAVSAEALKAILLEIMEDKKPELTEEAKAAAGPLCANACPKAVRECKRGENNEPCDENTKNTYVRIFEYICDKDGGEGGGDGGGDTCEASADLFSINQQFVYLQFGAPECAQDLAEKLSSEETMNELTSLATQLQTEHPEGEKVEVPGKLKSDFAKICELKCNEKVNECKKGEDGSACEEKLKTEYIALFTYICTQETTSVTV